MGEGAIGMPRSIVPLLLGCLWLTAASPALAQTLMVRPDLWPDSGSPQSPFCKRNQGNLVVTVNAGHPVRLRDVARIERGQEPAFTVVTAEGRNAALLNIHSQPDASTLVHPGWTATVDEYGNLVLGPSPP